MATSSDNINKKIREQIVQAAAMYATLVGKMYLYVYGEEYFEVLFPAGSFKHLTGVGTILSAEKFYRMSVSKKLSDAQLSFNKQQTVKKAKKKLPCLMRLPELTKSTVCVVRDLQTNTFLYRLGVTNLEFTLGVSQPMFDNKFPSGVYIPRSLRVKDKAIENSSSGDFIDFIFEKSTKRVDYKYDFMSYRGSENNPPRSIGDLISEKFYTEM